MPKSRKKAPVNSPKKPGSKLPYIHKTNNSNKELEEIRCTICMEHPHNAILVLCSSHEKGCRPYMCDTKSPLFDCYTQFQNSSAISSSCPLCRGKITGHKTVSSRARVYMNNKPRICSQAKCEFSGTYSELIKHSKDHAGEVPSNVSDDGTKGIAWVTLERGREYENVINAGLSNVSNDGNPLVLIHQSEQLVENRMYDVRLFSYVPIMPSNLIIRISPQGIDGVPSDQIGDLSAVHTTSA